MNIQRLFTAPITTHKKLLPQQKQMNDTVVASELSLKDSKTAIRETVMKKISEMQEAKPTSPADQVKIESLIMKFNSGKKLSSKELNFLMTHAPGSVERILRITAERERTEMMMRSSPTKLDVLLVANQAMINIEKTSQSPEDTIARANHLQNALAEYQKTDDFKDKPDHILDKKQQKSSLSKNIVIQPDNLLWQTAKQAYKREQ